MRSIIRLSTLIFTVALCFPSVQSLNKIQQVFTPEVAYGDDNQHVYSRLETGNNAAESNRDDTTDPLDDAAVHNNVGITYYKSGMYKKAITAFKEAIKIKPDYADAHRNMGVAYFRSGMSGDAIAALKKAIELDPGHIETYYDIGIIHLKSGRNKEAIDAFKEAVKIKPGEAVAHYKLGVAYYESDKNKKAMKSFKEAIHIKPDYAGAHYNLGILYLKSDKNKKAMDAFKEAVRIKPDHADAHYNLGILHFKSGLFNEAIGDFKQAIVAEPDHADAHFNLGIAFYNTGMYKEAKAAFKQVIAITPDYPEAQYHFGLAYAMLKDEVSSDNTAGALKTQGPHRDDAVDKKHTGPAPPSIYTVQTGSFVNIVIAQKHVASIIQGLNEKERDYLRIEKVGKYYTVRLGKYGDHAMAKILLEKIKRLQPAAIAMKAYYKKDRIKKLY